MKFELGRCLLLERLAEADMTIGQLTEALHYKHERMNDFIENKRMMPLKTAISIADTIGCSVNGLYELIALEAEAPPRVE
ncbi:transcriptional regulator [Paenibacillus sp. BIHB 4019]|uniref:Transcriptional regulator n=1 Tax=Paenibacillus sp. BIHB 4019 TaxID=1870819 RepID=A0A1B2DE76_9BACL|nr:transcriptional regulator [Paenibacillus sp. BIHB 4019]ANY66022.1 transcriptional regulator [Paenibacillus sp. BIHB 4019]